MKILGIETSCDETAAALVEKNNKTIKVLSNIIASSEKIHKKYGGIVPEQAAREQIKCIIPVIQEALDKVNCSKKNISAIAVTVGPGLIGSLLVGVETAKTLSYLLRKPIIPINHLKAHIYSNFINKTPQFPAICLIVSGGHTLLVLMKNHKQFKIIGSTRDDAAGECFDKCARLLNLAYPGGPEIERLAKKVKAKKIDSLQLKLPRPLLYEKTNDFSFSGLKTAVLYGLKNNKLPLSYWAYEIQEAITDVLVEKTLKAADQLKIKSILVGGGVAANQRLRDKFKFKLKEKKLKEKVKLSIPDKKWCTDNGAIIATAAFFNYKPTHWSKIKANPSLEI